MLHGALSKRYEPNARYLSPLRISLHMDGAGLPPQGRTVRAAPALPPGGGRLMFRVRASRASLADRAPGSRESQVNGMRLGELIEITNRSRGRSFQAGDFVVERWYGCRASGHGSQVPTRDQPREACQARSGRQVKDGRPD